PSGHVPVQVSHGGAGEFPYLTKALAERWVAELAAPNPYLVVSRGEQDYIQTYHQEPEYILEFRDGSPKKHFAATLDDASRVSALIWAWATGDRSALDDVAWTKLKLGGTPAAYSARRPDNARPSVSSSANSRSPPIGRPEASRVTLSPGKSRSIRTR